MKPSKSFEDWSFDELRDWCTWQVLSGIAQGCELQTRVHTILDTAIRWRLARDQKEKAKQARATKRKAR